MEAPGEVNVPDYNKYVAEGDKLVLASNFLKAVELYSKVSSRMLQIFISQTSNPSQCSSR